MSILNIKPVQSGQSKVILAIAGPSGSGKTLTALYIARGMVDKPSEIGLLDTENKRGSLYHDALDGKFMIGDLYAPFSPDRYAKAIKEFQDSGVKVLVIDSVSHEWEGEMGVDDIANAPKPDGTPRKMANWVGAKKEHKKFMSALLYSNMDIICCIRAREKTDFKDPNKPVSLGIQPICEKNFMFEMTASILMHDSGKRQQHIKVPNFLLDVFGKGDGYLGIETGKKIKQYFSSIEKDSPEIEKLKSEFLMVAEQGVKALEELWKKQTKENQLKLKGHVNVCKESAIAYDKLREENQKLDTEETKGNLDKWETLQVLLEQLKEYMTPEDILAAETTINEKNEAKRLLTLHKLNQLKIKNKLP